jgi:heme exporter protein C
LPWGICSSRIFGAVKPNAANPAKGVKKDMKNWWKIVAIGILIYAHTAGLLADVPRLNILNETIRSVYFHVPMWFTMVFLFSGSFVYAIIYLNKPRLENDAISLQFAIVGTVFGVLGLITGMIWAKFTWGDYWHGDIKQICSAAALIAYLIYFALRAAIDNQDQRAYVCGVANIFIFVNMLALVFVVPRLTSSMHPGSDGNPAFNMYDLDNKMRLVFYPAVIGWILIGLWMTTLLIRYWKLEYKITELEDE